MIKIVNLFGFDFISESDISAVASNILTAESYEKDGHFPFLITPNVDDIVKFSQDENKELRNCFSNSIYILPDGQLIVWTSGLFKKKLPKRLPGSDLLPFLLDNDKADCKVLALTSSDLISDRLSKENPNIISYTLPFFGKEDRNTINEVTARCVEILKKNDIRIVIIGISFPKQNILAMSIYDKLKSDTTIKMPLFCMLGASFEFYLKLRKRAPKFMQNLGLEWFHRFISEPRRLFKRYFIDDMAFFPILFKALKEKNNQGR